MKLTTIALATTLITCGTGVALAQTPDDICKSATKLPNGEWRLNGDVSLTVGGARVDLKREDIYRGEIKINDDDLHDKFEKTCGKR